MLRRQKGFTLIELVMIIVIIGILAAVAVPKYISLQQDAAEATFKGFLASLRSVNSMVYAKSIIAGRSTAYTMDELTTQIDAQGGITIGGAAGSIVTVTVAGYTHSFSLTAPNLPTAPGTVFADVGTW